MKIESNGKLKEINIKNHTCYYLDDIIKIDNFDLDNILINQKSYENILVYNIFCKILIVLHLCITKLSLLHSRK